MSYSLHLARPQPDFLNSTDAKFFIKELVAIMTPLFLIFPVSINNTFILQIKIPTKVCGVLHQRVLRETSIFSTMFVVF
jgi:hypothetical protein